MNPAGAYTVPLSGVMMKTILLVDDDRNFSFMLREVLSRAGHHVIPRFDAESALSVLREGTRVDLVITDHQMPGLEGLAFMLMLRQLLPSVPVIVLTGHGSVDMYVKAMSLGVFEYISKPVSIGELTRIVTAALERPQANDHLPIMFDF